MNNIMRAVIEVPTGIIKAAVNNLVHGSHISMVCAISPAAELTINAGRGNVVIQNFFRMRSGSHIRVRKGGFFSIGKNVSVNHGCMIVCHEKIVIGNDVQLSPNVLIYDHDHDYKTNGGVKSMRYITSPVVIGNNVWIGANCVVLRGTVIGDNAVIAAGSVIKGRIPEGTVVYNRKEMIMRSGR